MATRGLRDQVFLFSVGAARIPSSARSLSFSGSVGHRPATATEGSLPGWEATKGDVAFALHNPIVEVPLFSVRKSSQLFTLMSTATGGGGEMGLSEPLFFFFCITTSSYPRPKCKEEYLFSSPFSDH